jgi:hypothetical protein
MKCPHRRRTARSSPIPRPDQIIPRRHRNCTVPSRVADSWAAPSSPPLKSFRPVARANSRPHHRQCRRRPGVSSGRRTAPSTPGAAPRDSVCRCSAWAAEKSFPPPPALRYDRLRLRRRDQVRPRRPFRVVCPPPAGGADRPASPFRVSRSSRGRDVITPPPSEYGRGIHWWTVSTLAPRALPVTEAHGGWVCRRCPPGGEVLEPVIVRPVKLAPLLNWASCAAVQVPPKCSPHPGPRCLRPGRRSRIWLTWPRCSAADRHSGGSRRVPPLVAAKAGRSPRSPWMIVVAAPPSYFVVQRFVPSECRFRAHAVAAWIVAIGAGLLAIACGRSNCNLPGPSAKPDSHRTARTGRRPLRGPARPPARAHSAPSPSPAAIVAPPRPRESELSCAPSLPNSYRDRRQTPLPGESISA